LGWSAAGVLLYVDNYLAMEDDYLPHVEFVDAGTGRAVAWNPPPMPEVHLASVSLDYYAFAFERAEELNIEPVTGTVERVTVQLRPNKDDPTHYDAWWELDGGSEYAWTVIVPPKRCHARLVAPGECPPPRPVIERVVQATLLRSPDERHHVLFFENDEGTENEGPYVVPPLPLPAPPTEIVPFMRRFYGDNDVMWTAGALTEEVVIQCADGSQKPLGDASVTEPFVRKVDGARYIAHAYSLPCEATWAFGASTPEIHRGSSQSTVHNINHIGILDDDVDPGGPFVEGVRVRTLGDLTFREQRGVQTQQSQDKTCTLQRGEHTLELHTEDGCDLLFAGDVNGDGNTDVILHTAASFCGTNTLYLSNDSGWQEASNDHCGDVGHSP
jgi:hypothetical protein